jgi:signal peptidase II
VRELRSGASLTPRAGVLAIGAVVVLADRLTKWWAEATLPGSPMVLIDGFLQLRFVTNPGAAFGFFGDAGSLIAFVALIVIVAIVVVARRVDGWPEAAALGLVVGGAMGNLIDRVTRGSGLLDGEVVDFVDFAFFPAFNVADSAITVGAILAVVLALRGHGDEPRGNEDGAGA